MTINDGLNALQSNNTLIMLIAASIALYRYKRTSFVVAALVLCFANVLHMIFQFFLNILFDSALYDGFIYEFTVRLWYIFYAVTDMFFAVFIYTILKRMSIKPGVHCHIICGCFVLLGFIQIGRYADRFILSADYLSQVYTVGIPFINTFLLVVVLAGLFFDHKISSAKKGY